MIFQLPLNIRLRDSATFDNFFPGVNREAVEYLRLHNGRRDEPSVYLWGAAGTGKTHLLQAACHDAATHGLSTVYLPLSQAQEFSPAILEGMAELSLVCIDDIDSIAGDAGWESALFHLYNRMRDAGTQLVVAGNNSPGTLTISLPDLVSRLAWGTVFQIQALNDDDKLQVLQLRATARGMDMSLDVARYLLNRCPRDMPALYSMLDQLDRVSMSAQRKLTIPFVKEFIDNRL